MKKRLLSMVSPGSGFEDMGDLSNESKSAFVSLPPSALGKRLANHQNPATQIPVAAAKPRSLMN